MTRQHERIFVIFIHGLFAGPAAWADFCRLIEEDTALSHFVTTVCFPYESPGFRLHPARRPGQSRMGDDFAIRSS